MLTLPRKNLIAGLFCVLLGGFVAIRGYGYSIGTLADVGPGFFPAMLGTILLLCGAGLCVQSLRQADESVRLKVWPYLVIPGAIILFALTIDRFGLLPAVLVSTLVASLADRSSGWLSILLLACGLMALTYTVFVAILQIPLDPFIWRP